MVNVHRPHIHTCYSPHWQTSLAVGVGRITRTLKQNFPWKGIALYGKMYTVHLYVLLTPLANFTRSGCWQTNEHAQNRMPGTASPYMIKCTPSTYTCYSPHWQTSLAVDVGRITRTLKHNFPWKSTALHGQMYTVHLYVLLTPLANFTRSGSWQDHAHAQTKFPLEEHRLIWSNVYRPYMNVLLTPLANFTRSGCWMDHAHAQTKFPLEEHRLIWSNVYRPDMNVLLTPLANFARSDGC